jgi:hypothetical protein
MGQRLLSAMAALVAVVFVAFILGLVDASRTVSTLVWLASAALAVGVIVTRRQSGS